MISSMKLLVSAMCMTAIMMPAAVASIPEGATVEYYHVDVQGSIIAKTNAVGELIQRHAYEPFGADLRDVQDGPSYTGHVRDKETRLTYMQQRYYDADIGVFLSVDPVAAYEQDSRLFNRYAYAFNSPYMYTDPDGLCPSGKVTGSRICGGGAGNNVQVTQYNSSGPAGGQSGGRNAVANAPAIGSSSLARREDGKIPVPGVVGWKTGVPEFAWTPEQVDSAGVVITGAAVVGGGAVAVQSSMPFVVTTLGGISSGARGLWSNLSFDGPSAGGMHANGRLAGVRWKGGQWGLRLDLHPINSGKTPILHINYGPAARGEASHIILYDPRWLRGSD